MAAPTDRRKFKTPYFEIAIGDSLGKRMVTLPHQLLRLVEKVEILETFERDELYTITLVFIEGSREPASPDSSLGTQGLYKIDKNIAGYMTNRTGLLVDLRFSGDGGITFISKEESQNNRLNTNLLTNTSGEKVSRTYESEPKSPTLLFQQRNQVKVTWGYREDTHNARSLRAYISVVTTEFPENGQPRTTITCTSTRAFLDQIAKTNGTSFAQTEQKVPIQLFQSDGTTAKQFSDPPTPELLSGLAKTMQMPSLISPVLPGEKLDNDHFKLLMGGQSLDQFIKNLAITHNAYYNIMPDPATGKDTLIFLHVTDFESKPIVNDPRLFTYKAPGSIIKSVSVHADFINIVGSTITGKDDQGNQLQFGQNVGGNQSLLFPSNNEKVIDTDPTNNNAVHAAKAFKEKVGTPGFTGKLENHPDSGSDYFTGLSQSYAHQSSRSIEMDLVTLGYPRLTPGVIDIQGLGRRYSGKYRLMTVTHIIDPNGYVCRASAVNFTLSDGIKVSDAKKGQEVQEQVAVRVFQPKVVQNPSQQSSASGNILQLLRDQYETFIYKK